MSIPSAKRSTTAPIAAKRPYFLSLPGIAVHGWATVDVFWNISSMAAT